MHLPDGPFQTSCSIGVVVFGATKETDTEILRCADSAMYVSKEAGKNRITYYCKNMLDELDRSNVLMGELVNAIKNNELSLYYQQQVALDGSLKGVEALLRWHHPERGMIPPDQFIEIAEQSGEIIPVTEWILEEAFKTLSRWQNDTAFKKVKLSINISARQFHEIHFVERIEALITKYSVNPSLLVLEMTEHVLTYDTILVAKVMTRLRAVGVGFSLDDFGTGYSSLVHMRELPFNELKIDGKFVSDLENNPEDQAIVRSIIAMADALNLETVAEWVETKGQMNLLTELGCSRLQGFLFGPAVPLLEV